MSNWNSSKGNNNSGDKGNKKGVGGKGWRGDKTWRQNVDRVSVPTQQEAIDLINEAGGTVNRIEGPHNSPNPHNFNHINYTTPSGGKGTIRIQ